MPVSLNISSDIDKAIRRLSTIEKKQIPFATVLTINSTLFDVRKEIVEKTAPRAFIIRNKRFFGVAFRVEKATKRKLAGAVFDRLGRGSLDLQARGGTKRPRGGRLAIPSEFVEAKRTASGRIPKRLKPRALLTLPGPRGRKAFKVKFSSGQEAIVRRTTKKGLPLQVLFLFERSARIPKRFPFFEDATKTTRRVLPRNFSKGFRRALATAR